MKHFQGFQILCIPDSLLLHKCFPATRSSSSFEAEAPACCSNYRMCFQQAPLTLQTKTMCHSMHQAFRYMLINQCEFLDNSGGKFHPQERKHSILWEKNLLVIIKQLQSKSYQGQSFLPTEHKLPPEQMALMP